MQTRKLSLLFVLVTIVLAMPGGLRAQGQSALTNPLAYIGRDGNVYVAGEPWNAGQSITGDAAGVPKDTSPFFSKTLDYRHLTWSPTGNMLAFIEHTSKSLIIVESGKNPTVVMRGVDSHYPPAFSADGREVAYVVQTEQQIGTNNQDRVLQIQAVPAAGGTPRALGSIAVTAWNCNDGTADPADLIYFDALNVVGDSALVFAWTASGFLHTTSCNGVGLGFHKDGQQVWQNPNLQNATLSPDRTQIVAVDYEPASRVKRLVLVDLASGKLTPVNTQPNVDHVAFSSDGKSILYSAVEPLRTVRGNPDSAVGKQLFGERWPVIANESTLFVWSIPTTGGQSTMVYRGVGRGIASIAPARHKPSAILIVATSLAAMIDSINAGDPTSLVLEAAPRADLVSISLDGAAASVTLAQGDQALFSPAASFVVIPAQVVGVAPTVVLPTVAAPTLVVPPTVAPTEPPQPPTVTPSFVLPVNGQCPGFLPSRLKVGGKGRVLPGTSNRLRQSPSDGTVHTTIPAGATFDVLEGPICTSNAIAWWKVNYGGIVGWTAEGQESNYWLEPYTDTPPIPPVNDAFTVEAVTATGNPATSKACPTTFNFFGHITVNRAGMVTYRWVRSDGATGDVQSLAFKDAGSKTVTTQWILLSTGTYWWRLHVLTPASRLSNQATVTLNCDSPTPMVVNISAGVNPTTSKTCPNTFRFGGMITVSRAGKVTYRWERSDGATGPVQTLTFNGPGSKAVATQWQLGASGTFWQRIHVLTPDNQGCP
jgi:hypothetical protein